VPSAELERTCLILDQQLEVGKIRAVGIARGSTEGEVSSDCGAIIPDVARGVAGASIKGLALATLERGGQGRNGRPKQDKTFCEHDAG
jgi:hypothetical protein